MWLQEKGVSVVWGNCTEGTMGDCCSIDSGVGVDESLIPLAVCKQTSQESKNFNQRYPKISYHIQIFKHFGIAGLQTWTIEKIGICRSKMFKGCFFPGRGSSPLQGGSFQHSIHLHEYRRCISFLHSNHATILRFLGFVMICEDAGTMRGLDENYRYVWFIKCICHP